MHIYSGSSSLKTTSGIVQWQLYPESLGKREPHHLLHRQHSDIGRTEQICEGHLPILTFIRIGWLVLANAINLLEEMKGGTDGRENVREKRGY